ncbi:hypothetical protein BKA80DRAFT_96149 [Phyllosticta citrichinensis]
MASKSAVCSLYRRSLKLSLSWAVHRHLWRGQALYIRSLFEDKKTVTDPRLIKDLLKETEALLEHWKHPDPYVPPTAPGGEAVCTESKYSYSRLAGSKYERNVPAPILDPPPKMEL